MMQKTTSQLKREIKWWSPNDILGYNCIFNFVESPRGFGKTYGLLKFFINRFEKHGEQWAYFRRYQEDIDFVRFNLFSNLEADGAIKFAQCRLYGNRLIYNEKGLDQAEFEIEFASKAKKITKTMSKAAARAAKKQNDELREELMNTKIDKTYDRIMGISFPIAVATRIKSAGLSKLKWGVFEEYLEEFGNYLPNEVEKIMSVYESIDRSRDEFRMFFLGNRSKDVNPYYEFMQIIPEEESKFTHIKRLSLVLQRFQSDSAAAFKATTRFGKAIEHLDYGKFIKGIGSTDDRSLILKMNTKKLQFICNVATYEGLYGLYKTNDGFHIGARRKNQKTFNMTFLYKKDIPHIRTATYLDKVLRETIMQGKLTCYSLRAFTGLKKWFTPN